MKGKDLLEGLGFVSEAFVNERLLKQPKKPPSKRPSLLKIAGLAACFALTCILFGVYYNSLGLPPMPSQNPSDMAAETPPIVPLYLNRADDARIAQQISLEGAFNQDLSKGEMASLFPTLVADYNLSATAHFAKTDRGATFHGISADLRTPSGATATILANPKPIRKSYILDDTAILSKIKNVFIEVGYFDLTTDKEILYFAYFHLGEVHYSLELQNGDEKILSRLLSAMIDSGETDFSLIKPQYPEGLRDEWLTLEEAYLEAILGKYIPKNLPSGYKINRISRFVGKNADYLSLSLSKGTDNLWWEISHRPEPVPKALGEALETPVFSIDTLNLDVVKTGLSPPSQGEEGDTTKSVRHRFAVAYDDGLVTVTANGIASEALYALLHSLE